MSENYAAVLYGPKDLRYEKWPMPEICDNDVLIKIGCVGICGSDLKLYSTGKCGFEVVSDPMVMGHEGAGVVIKVGSGVTNVDVGDRVAIEPTQPCRSCEYCKKGRYNLCDQPRYCSTTGAMGNLCRYYKHVADFCHKIPNNVSMEEGAAVQPLAIAIHACTRAGVRLGCTLLVLGAGPIGVLCAMTARAMGAAKILITDIVESRLEIAKKLAADHTLLVTLEQSDQEIVEKIRNILGTTPDITIDACGCESAQRTALMVETWMSGPPPAHNTGTNFSLIEEEAFALQMDIYRYILPAILTFITRTGGTVMVVGIGEETVRVPLTAAMLREVDVRGAHRLLNSYPIALAAVASGTIDLKSFITHHYPLEKSKEAMEFAKTGEAMKIIIHA